MADSERQKTARHEAGHAVAALHYDRPLQQVSIDGPFPTPGTTRFGVSDQLHDAVVVLCGPLAEKDRSEFRPGVPVKYETVGTDHALILSLKLTEDERAACGHEALIFMSKSEVQDQIDRVAGALLDHVTLSADQVRSVSGFGRSLASEEWREAN